MENDDVVQNGLTEVMIDSGPGLVIVHGPVNSGKSQTLQQVAQLAYAKGYKTVRLLPPNSPIGISDGIPSVVIERKYKLPLKSKHGEKLALARSLVLQSSGSMLADNVQVVIVDETDSPELIRMAGLLSEAGCLVVVAIHTGTPLHSLDALSKFNAISGPLKEREFSFDEVFKATIECSLVPNNPDSRNIVFNFIS